jgi:hypothetical protein
LRAVTSPAWPLTGSLLISRVVSLVGSGEVRRPAHEQRALD